MATVIEQIEANIAKATTKLAQDRALLAQMRAAVPGLKARKDALFTSMGVATSQASSAVDNYIKVMRQYEPSTPLTAAPRSPQGKASKIVKDNAGKVRDAEFAKWAAADREWKAADAKMTAAFKAENAGLQAIKNLNASLVKERAKPDTSAAKAAAQAVIDSALAALATAKQATLTAKADVITTAAVLKTATADYTKLHAATIKAQGIYNPLKAKAALPKATDLTKQQAANALTALNAAIALELPAAAAHKAAGLANAAAIQLVSVRTQAETKANAAVAAAKAALAKIK